MQCKQIFTSIATLILQGHLVPAVFPSIPNLQFLKKLNIFVKLYKVADEIQGEQK